jgi:N-acyl-L-homoserine lactone synthetase
MASLFLFSLNPGHSKASAWAKLRTSHAFHNNPRSQLWIILLWLFLSFTLLDKVNKINYVFNMRGMVGMAEYRLVSDAWEKDELFRVRYQVYCKEKKWLKESDYPDGREIDEFDAHSAHFLAIKDNMAVGTVRAIFPSELGLPATNTFGIMVPELVVHYVEISRLAVAKEARGLEVTMGLLHTLFAWCLEKEITHGYAIVENDLLNFLIRLGYPFKKLGEKKYLYGSYNLPVCLELSETIALDYHDNIALREEAVSILFL